MKAVSVAVVVAVALVALVDEAVLLASYSVAIAAAAVEHQLFDDQRRGGQPVGRCLLPAPAAAEVGEAGGGGRGRSSIATLLGPVPTAARAHH